MVWERIEWNNESGPGSIECDAGAKEYLDLKLDPLIAFSQKSNVHNVQLLKLGSCLPEAAGPDAFMVLSRITRHHLASDFDLQFY